MKDILHDIIADAIATIQCKGYGKIRLGHLPICKQQILNCSNKYFGGDGVRYCNDVRNVMSGPSQIIHDWSISDEGKADFSTWKLDCNLLYYQVHLV